MKKNKSFGLDSFKDEVKFTYEHYNMLVKHIQEEIVKLLEQCEDKCIFIEPIDNGNGTKLEAFRFDSSRLWQLINYNDSKWQWHKCSPDLKELTRIYEIIASEAE